MTYKEQMNWIDYQIENLIATREAMGWEDFKDSDEEIHLRALTNIKSGYSFAKKKADELSWSKYPDRMGQ